MERLIGRYCKIVTKEPGEERASVVTGILEDVDYQDGFILVDSEQGLGCLRINTIIAIKPGHKKPNEKRNIKEDEKALIGIGTLIVFIAMILVAAVAASVVIQTSENLQQRAQSVGMQTIREVSSGMVIQDITGYTNSNRTKIQYLAILVRPRAGSKDIDLSLVTATLLYNNLSILTLNTSRVVAVNTADKTLFDSPISASQPNVSIFDNLTAQEYGIISVHDYDSSVINTNGMNSGDRVYFVMNLSALIPESDGLPSRQEISGQIQPETGAPGVYDVTAPAVYSKRIIDLW